jgi:hypothetical protein
MRKAHEILTGRDFITALIAGHFEKKSYKFLAMIIKSYVFIEQEKPFKEPFWKLGDVPIKPVSLPSIEDIENEMKTIESEMQALLRPEEKYQRRSIAFTIGKAEAARSQTPGCVPQRLLKHQQKAQVTQRILTH